MARRTLYQCSHARVRGERIYCEKGHLLSPKSENGTLNIRRLARGDLLALGVCQQCPDFDRMGPPLAAAERGWLRTAKGPGSRSAGSRTSGGK
jgi:hypothetical protein